MNKKISICLRWLYYILGSRNALVIVLTVWVLPYIWNRESLEDPFGHGGSISGFGDDPLRVGPILLEALENELAVFDALESTSVRFPAGSE